MRRLQELLIEKAIVPVIAPVQPKAPHARLGSGRFLAFPRGTVFASLPLAGPLMPMPGFVIRVLARPSMVATIPDHVDIVARLKPATFQPGSRHPSSRS
jgi:hypothetical protein